MSEQQVSTDASDLEEVASEEVAEEMDQLQTTVNMIENSDKGQAYTMIDDMFNSSSENDFTLGGALNRVKESKWYAEDGFDTFREFVQDKYGIKFRKAMYLMSNYTNLANKQIGWDKVSHIGWTKLSVITRVITAENIDDWVKKAEEMTVLQLKGAVAEAEKMESNDTPSDEPSSAQKYLSIKIHVDQEDVIRGAIDKAKLDANTEFDGQALEAICLSFLSGSGASKPLSLMDTMKSGTPEEALEAFSALWPDIDVSVTIPG